MGRIWKPQRDVYDHAEASAGSCATRGGRAGNAAIARSSSADAAAGRLTHATNTGSLTPRSRAVLAVSSRAHAHSASVSNCRLDGRQKSRCELAPRCPSQDRASFGHR
jgi:hypothetical protein